MPKKNDNPTSSKQNTETPDLVNSVSDTQNTSKLISTSFPSDTSEEISLDVEGSTNKQKNKFRLPLFVKVIFVLLLIIFVIAGGLSFWAYKTFLPPAQKLINSGNSMQLLAIQLQQAVRDRDLVTLQAGLGQAKTHLADIEATIKEVEFVKSWPYLEPYFNDSDSVINAGRYLINAGEIGIEAITPYADLLGLKTGSESIAENTQDRIEILVTTLEKIEPQIDEINNQIMLANKSLSQIDTARYPEYFQGFMLREEITKVKDTLNSVSIVLDQTRPLVSVAPKLMGVDKPMTYLVLFQNDAEIRPTGGFLTAYAILRVDKGKVSTQFTSDIYDLDNKYFGREPAPKALIDHIADPYKKEQLAGKTPIWRLRDRNLSPDFKISAEDFLRGYKDTGSPKYDGVVAMDTKVLLSLLEVIGPIGVAGFTRISPEIDTRCNCPQVIYELENAISYETPYIRENRKAVLGNVMYSILLNAMAQPKEKFPELAEATIKSIQQKNVLMYFPDEDVQKSLESMNVAGRVVNSENDYLLVVDTNLGGRKSQLYIDQEIDLKVEAGSNGSRNTLTLTYRNTQSDDKWLNGISPNWLRIYVPLGSKLIAGKGSELEIKSYDELDKTVFEGFFQVKPKGISKLTFEYETPSKIIDNQYKLLVQKQAGVKNHQLNINVNNIDVVIPSRLSIVDDTNGSPRILDSDKIIVVNL